MSITIPRLDYPYGPNIETLTTAINNLYTIIEMMDKRIKKLEQIWDGVENE